jgi:hypothetical protein
MFKKGIDTFRIKGKEYLHLIYPLLKTNPKPIIPKSKAKTELLSKIENNLLK